VGSGPAGAGHFLGCPAVGVDTEFNLNRISRFLTPVIADATLLPFSDGAFDVVVSIDTLEHIPAERRADLVKELVRVARKHVVIGVPTGAAAADQDTQLDRFYSRHHGERHHFLIEHLLYGLPKQSEIERTIRSAAEEKGKAVRIRPIGNANLTARAIYMRIGLHPNVLLKALYVFLSLLRYVAPVVNSGPFYRKIFFCELEEA